MKIGILCVYLLDRSHRTLNLYQPAFCIICIKCFKIYTQREKRLVQNALTILQYMPTKNDLSKESIAIRNKYRE